MVQSILVPVSTRPIRGEVEVPGSKSITNRAMLIAGLAQGRTVLQGALFSEDTTVLAEALRALGVAVTEDSERNVIIVEGSAGPFKATSGDLYTANAGTATRFLVAALALGMGTFRVDGTARMRQRPIQPLLDGLVQLGVDARSETGNGCPPVVIETRGMTGGNVRMRGDISSQYFSALMLAAPLTLNGLDIEVAGDLVSKPYVDLTARVMADFGALSSRDDFRTVTIPGAQRYTGREYRIEPDASAASYFFATAAVSGGDITVRHTRRDSFQGDIHFLDILEQMGCVVDQLPEGVRVLGPKRLAGVTVDMREISDVSLTLAAIAPFAAGPVQISGIEHVRVQESDRIAAMTEELRKLGVRVDEHSDGWTIHPSQPVPSAVDTYQDHRIAMSLALIGTRVPGVIVNDPDCVSKTFPDYFERLNSLVGE
jgi:3-phosphoshikimate 1-carboxyvinyltransferase